VHPLPRPQPLRLSKTLLKAVTQNNTLPNLSLYREFVFELKNLFTLPWDLPLTHLDPTTGLPLDQDFTAGGLDYIENLPLLEMGSDPEATLRGSIGDQEQTMEGRTKSEGYVHRADELAGMVDNSTIVGGKTYAELSLYEKKSVLINRELE
jgi:hypothetical protein